MILTLVSGWGLFPCASSAQVYHLGTYCGGGAGNIYSNHTLIDKGSFWQTRILEDYTTPAGTRMWEFEDNVYYNTWRASDNTPVNIAGHNIVIPPNASTASAFYRFSPLNGGDGARMLATTLGYYYTFNIQENGYANAFMSILETAYNPKTISVSDAVAPYGGRTATVTLSAPPDPGEYVYIRYTTDNYVNSTIIPVSFTGKIGTVIVPVSSTYGVTQQYYAYSSNKTKAEIDNEVVLYSSQVPHDMLALELSNGISNIFTNQVVVTSSGGNTLMNTYPTMQTAFASINAGINHTGTVTIALIGNTIETAIAELKAGDASPANYSTIGIRPAGGVARTITGNLASPLIFLNGADNIIIDGREGGVGSSSNLTICNTSTSSATGTSSISMENDATSNTVIYCNVQGSSTTTPATVGGNIWIGALAVTTGNDNNIITNCNIGPAGTNLPTKGVCFSGSTGSTTLNNSGCAIINNNIFDYFSATTGSAGIYVGNGTTSSSFTSNLFYQTSLRTQTTGSQHSAIWMANASGNDYTITGNTIGYSAAAGTGIYSITGVSGTQIIPIYLNVGSSAITNVQSNIITSLAISGSCDGIASNPPFAGIYVFAGLVDIGGVAGTLTSGNTIGSMSTNGDIIYTTNSGSASNISGILSQSTNAWVTNNNKIGGITVTNTNVTPGAILLSGIKGNGGSGSWICSYNTIGGGISNSLNNLSTANSSYVDGISNVTFSGSFNNNTICNLNCTGGSTTVSIAGIFQTANTAKTISQNTIFNLSNNNPASGANTVSGIEISGATGNNLVERNFIYSISNASSTISSGIFGVKLNAGTTTLQNNIIGLNQNSAGSVVYGINDNNGTNKIYFNTVALTGSNTSTTADAALYSSPASDIRDNIFYNARTGAGSHYSYNRTGSATLNYNNYFGTPLGPGGAQSITTDPVMVNPASTTANDYKPFISLAGITIAGITTDYNVSTRATVPTIGAIENDKIVTTSLSAATVCAGSSIDVTFFSSGSFLAGNTYTVQLSDATGSFASPTLLSPTLTSNASGSFTINGVTIPIAATTSSLYKIRVVSSEPVLANDLGLVLTVNAIPSAPTGISASPATICTGSSSAISVTNPGAGLITDWYTVSCGGTAVSGGTGVNSLSVSPSSTTTYYARTRITTSGCVSNSCASVTVSLNPSPPVPTGIAASPATVCGGSSSTISVTNPGAGYTTDWYTSSCGGTIVPGGSGINSLSVSPSASTVYYALIRNTATGCISACTNVTVNVNPLPVPAPAASGAACIGGILQLTSADYSPATYTWTGPNGFSSSLQNPTPITPLTASASGTYSVTVLDGAGCSGTGSVIVTVGTPPVATASTSTPVLCEGGTILLTGGPGGMTTYSWTGPNSYSTTTASAPFSTDFNSLASSSTSNLLPTSWFYSESGSNANFTYTAGTGSSTTGDTYSFGTTAADRAFGTLRSSNLISTIGASFLNSTGTTITQASIAYTGEQWRLGATGRADRLDFQYSLDATSIITGTWTDFNPLDFTSPNTTTLGQLDGNLPANRTALTATITGLNIANSSFLWIRFTDLDITGAEDGLAVDDFSLVFGSGNTQSPSITNAIPNMSGTYYLTVTDANHCTSQAQTIVTVNAKPVPAPASSGSACLGEILNLTSADVTSGVYSWTGPNGFSSSLQNPSVSPVVVGSAGTYSVTITDGNTCSATASITLAVFPAPSAVTSTNTGPYCEGATIQLNASPNGKSSYTWTGPGGWSTTSASSNYAQDFNTLANTGTSSSLPSGAGYAWYLKETGSNADINYSAGNGSSNAGDTYSFGTTAAADWALGGIQSSNLIQTFGASFTNTTILPVSTVIILYTGEQWRLGTTGRDDRLDFQYSLDATSLTTGTWTDENTLDFTAPIKTGTLGQLDGNAAANRTLITSTISGLTIPAGAKIWIRWNDLNASGADDGLAVDDFSITLIAGSNQNPTRPNATAGMTGTYNLSTTDANGCIVNANTNVFVGNQWIGNTANWEVPSNWSCGLPGATTDVRIPTIPSGGKMPVIGTTITVDCRDLVIQSGATLTIQSDATSSGSLIMNGVFSGTGNVIYNRYLENNRWYITSSPVNNSFNLNGTTIEFKNGGYNFAPYVEADNAGWGYVASVPTSLNPGQGYLLKLLTGNTVQYTGAVNQDVNAAITNTASSPSYTVYDNGWNAIGNPFTSAIKITGNDGFIAQNNTKLESNYNAVYLWNETGSYTGTEQYYKVINNSGYTGKAYGGSIAVDYVQAGQGFLINAGIQGASTVVFKKGTTGMQIHSTATTLKKTDISWPGLTLLASNNGRTRSTIVAFNENMTTGLDETYDAGLLSTSDFNLYTHLAAGGNETDFTIQCLPENRYDSLCVPVGVDLPEVGQLTFKACGVILPEGFYPVLEDRLLQKYTALKTETDSLIVEITEPTWGIGRFYLHIGGITTVNNNKLPEIRNFAARFADQKITVFGTPGPGSRAWLYDMSGRKLGGEYRLTSANENEIPTAGLANGVYLLRIEGKTGSEILKITILNR